MPHSVFVFLFTWTIRWVLRDVIRCVIWKLTAQLPFSTTECLYNAMAASLQEIRNIRTNLMSSETIESLSYISAADSRNLSSLHSDTLVKT